MKTFIAVDLGRSAVKLAAYDGANDKREMLLYPSAVIPAKPLSDEGARARAMSETVTVNTKSYFSATRQSGRAMTTCLVGCATWTACSPKRPACRCLSPKTR